MFRILFFSLLLILTFHPSNLSCMLTEVASSVLGCVLIHSGDIPDACLGYPSLQGAHTFLGIQNVTESPKKQNDSGEKEVLWGEQSTALASRVMFAWEWG